MYDASYCVPESVHQQDHGSPVYCRAFGGAAATRVAVTLVGRTWPHFQTALDRTSIFVLTGGGLFHKIVYYCNRFGRASKKK